MVFGKGQKVAVTGGAVFGGVYLAEVLVYVGARVTVSDNLETGA